MRGHDSVIEFSNSEPLRLRLISVWSLDNSTVKHILFLYFFLRKEVIQPHLPIRLDHLLSKEEEVRKNVVYC